MVGGRPVPVDEERVDVAPDLARGDAALHELPAQELVGHHEDVDAVDERREGAMEAQDRGIPGALRHAVAIATAGHAVEIVAAHTPLADLAPRVELTRRAHQPIVVDGLDDRHPEAVEGRIGGGGNDREDVLDDGRVGTLPLDEPGEVAPRAGREVRGGHERSLGERAHPFDLGVVAGVGHHGVTARLEPLALVVEDDALAAGLLVVVVAQEQLRLGHGRRGSLRLLRGHPKERGGPPENGPC